MDQNFIDLKEIKETRFLAEREEISEVLCDERSLVKINLVHLNINSIKKHWEQLCFILEKCLNEIGHYSL